MNKKQISLLLNFNGIESSPFEIKWRESISRFRSNITDLKVYRLPYHLKFQMTW